MDRKEGQSPVEQATDVSEKSAALPPFDYEPRTRVVFGSGTVVRLGELAHELEGTSVLLVTDKGLADAGHERRAAELLNSAGLQVTIFDDVQPNPTTRDIELGLIVARS